MALSEIEKTSLSAIGKGKKDAETISKDTSLQIDSVRRAVEWLEAKKLINSKALTEKKIVLTKKGKEAEEKGLPEEQLIKLINEKKSVSLNELKNYFEGNEVNIALGKAKRNAWILIIKKENETMIEATGVYEETKEKNNLIEFMKKINSFKGKELNEEEKENMKELIERGLIELKEETSKEYSLTSEGTQALESKEFNQKRKFNIHEPAPEIFIGKKQPYIQFLNSIRRKLVELGFEEMNSPLIVPEFYNFDVLFQPQNHPARTWTDTYQLLNPKKGTLPAKEKIKAIKNAHESGGVSASNGWGYTWMEEIAERLMPAAHGTAHSARTLTNNPKNPAKYFAIARCFRPDVLDATHLIEFNQTEGFILGEELNFRHLLSTLKDFAVEIAGAEKVKFFPDYYPFTEPSVQLSAKHPDLGWVELGGAGMFRPEILENLGIKGQAIAWGIGIDRLAMFKLGIKDIRYLFSNDLNWLRKTPLVIE
ncbi:MAG: phenylalanine--tRNA ligase subunit alpha [Candidatus Diapherotrites archaeon]|nr:phenylalanine--tRNA ligase subunit alpha [Candidatus Diapherotrites archaeon]